MIVIRDTFQLKFGKAKDAKSLMKEGLELGKAHDFKGGRAFTDLTGTSYRLILESEWKNLADWESSMQKAMTDERWHVWYQKFIPLVESASREILNLVE